MQVHTEDLQESVMSTTPKLFCAAASDLINQSCLNALFEVGNFL